MQLSARRKKTTQWFGKIVKYGIVEFRFSTSQRRWSRPLLFPKPDVCRSMPLQGGLEARCHQFVPAPIARALLPRLVVIPVQYD